MKQPFKNFFISAYAVADAAIIQHDNNELAAELDPLIIYRYKDKWQFVARFCGPKIPKKLKSHR
jgi:hypothetical protein